MVWATVLTTRSEIEAGPPWDIPEGDEVHFPSGCHNPLTALNGRIDLPLLRFVNRYGDFYFNSRQMDSIIPELEILQRAVSGHDDPRVHSYLASVVALAERCSGRPGSLLVFRGD